MASFERVFRMTLTLARRQRTEARRLASAMPADVFFLLRPFVEDVDALESAIGMPHTLAGR